MEKRTCSIDGCDRPQRARGWCSAHWTRWRQHGDPRAGGTSPGAGLGFIDELLSSEPTDDCVDWPYGKRSNGYGVVWVDGKLQGAHRHVLSLVTGKNPSGLDAAHLPGVCHTRSCVNPRHLRWATRAENLADKLIDGTDNRGEKNGQAKLTAEQVLAIRADDRVQRVVAADYGIGQQTVSEIKLGKKWGWLVNQQETTS